jgi:hypothetical protein
VRHVPQPRWAAQTLFKDGATHFRLASRPVRFPATVDRHDRRYTLEDVAVSFVTDFETGQWVEAKNAFFVHGSSASVDARRRPAHLRQREAADN